MSVWLNCCRSAPPEFLRSFFNHTSGLDFSLVERGKNTVKNTGKKYREKYREKIKAESDCCKSFKQFRRLMHHSALRFLLWGIESHYKFSTGPRLGPINNNIITMRMTTTLGLINKKNKGTISVGFQGAPKKDYYRVL